MTVEPFVPEVVQTGVVVLVNVTGSPELAVALTEKGALPKVWFASAAKAIVWLAMVTVKVVLVSLGAGLKLMSPA